MNRTTAEEASSPLDVTGVTGVTGVGIPDRDAMEVDGEGGAAKKVKVSKRGEDAAETKRKLMELADSIL